MNTALDACFAFSRSYTQILVILVVHREKCQEARCIFILLPCQHLLRYYTILLHSQVFDNLVQAVSLGLMHGFGYSCWAVSCLSLRLSIPFQHLNSIHVESLPRWFSGKESTCPHRRCRFNLWVGRIPCSRRWLLIPVLLPGKFHERGASRAVVHGVAKSWTGLSNWACTHNTRGIKKVSVQQGQLGLTQSKKVTAWGRWERASPCISSKLFSSSNSTVL